MRLLTVIPSSSLLMITMMIVTIIIIIIILITKTAILGTSHIIRKVLQCDTWSLSGGDHRWFKRSTRKERPVTREDVNNNNNNNTAVSFKDCNKRKNLFVSWINARGMCNIKAYTISIYRTIAFLKCLALVSKPGLTSLEKKLGPPS
jgi:hypothetical protein